MYQNIIGNYEMWRSRRKETIMWTDHVIKEEMLRRSQREKEHPT